MVWEPWALLVALIVIDYILGTIKGIITEGFQSSKMRMGLLHKGTYLVALVLGFILERIALYYELPYALIGCIVSLIYVWVVLSETGSILENLVAINPKLAYNEFMRIFDRREKEQKTAELPNLWEDEEDHAEGN